jgi:hypothetical protein
VVNRADLRPCFLLGRGQPIRRPLRVPVRDARQLPSATERFARPVLNASLEHPTHHGATHTLISFQVRRKSGSDQPCHGVRSASGTP